MISVFIGYDSEKGDAAYQVCRASILENASEPVSVTPLKLDWLRRVDLYKRAHYKEDRQKYDAIDDRPFSTEFSFSRFLVPSLRPEGWAIFCDSDFLFMDDIAKLWALRDDAFPVMCVKHDYKPKESAKMDGQKQQRYFRKNWSSLMLWNCSHEQAQIVTPHIVNCKKGSWLHGFSWLNDDQIGEIPEAWNWLDGHSSPSLIPKAVHFTRGTPDMGGWEDTRYAAEWLKVWGNISEH